MKFDIDILEIKDWKTPATEYPIKKVGSAELIRVPYPKDLYRMEGINGVDYYFSKESIPCTILKIDGKEWMVDDPPHYFGMQALAYASKGKVLVAGLGLGLVLHELEKNDQVSEVDCIEKNQDVIDLISPCITNNVGKTIITNADFWIYLKMTKKQYDTVILDIWAWKSFDPIADIFEDMKKAVVTVKKKFPKANVYIWGMRDKALNPAVTKEPYYISIWRR